MFAKPWSGPKNRINDVTTAIAGLNKLAMTRVHHPTAAPMRLVVAFCNYSRVRTLAVRREENDLAPGSMIVAGDSRPGKIPAAPR